MSTNDQVLRDVGIAEGTGLVDLQAASAALWKEARDHPPTSTCDCPLLEALAVLYERGYRISKVGHG